MKARIQMLIGAMVLMASAAMAQYREYDNEDPKNYVMIGTQIPIQHSLIYGRYLSPNFSVNAGFGLITSPYTTMLFNSLEKRGVVSSNERKIIDRTFLMGTTYQLGANFHFAKNYVRAFGQLASLRGNMTYTDLANLYLNTNIPPITRFLSPIKIRSVVPMVGILYGRSFSIGEHSEIHLEGSIAKTLGHNTKYTTNTFLDDLGFMNDLVYTKVNNDLTTYFSKYGWVPSFNVYYVFKF